jgi:DNA-binding CsgD family transcriptional regulator
LPASSSDDPVLPFPRRTRNSYGVADAIVGREVELARIGGFLDAVGSGLAGLLFDGEAGIGKTTLWSAAVEQARRRPYVVLSARAVESEAKLAFTALGDLLEPVADDVLPELPEPQRRAIAVALLREEPGVRALDQRAVGAGTTTILRLLARSTPVVVAVDDLQWLDRASARVLDFALRRLGDVLLGLVASNRPGGDSSSASDLERALPASRLTRIQVGPLTLAALHEVLKSRLGRSFPRRTLLRIEEVAGGNPFFALEIARDLSADALPGLPFMPLPDNLVRLVEARISNLPTATRMMLLAAAAVPTPTVKVVAGAVEATTSRSLHGLERAESAGIVRLDGGGIRFSHPLFAAAVYSSASPADRRRVHARLACLVGDVEERARHLALAANGVDEATATKLDAAAEHARRRGAPDTAAALAAQACLLTPPHGTAQIRRRTVKAAEYQFHSGELQRARAMLDEVLQDAPAGLERADALRLLGEILSQEKSFPEAIRAYEDALDQVGDDLAARSVIETRLAFAVHVGADFAGAKRHADRALSLAEQLGEPELVAEALAVSLMPTFLLGLGVDEGKIERALALEDPHRPTPIMMRPSLCAGGLALFCGDLERSVSILSPLRARILESGYESDLPFVSSYLSWAECWRGNLAAATAHCEESLECAARIGGGPILYWAFAFAAVPAAYAGDRPLAMARIAKCRELSDRVEADIALQWAGWARAVLALSESDPQAADDVLSEFVPIFEQHGVPDPIVGFFLPDAIEAMISTGQLERAERLLKTFEESAARLSRGWAITAAGRCRAHLKSAGADLDGASRTAAKAVALGERLELRLELARTLLVAGQIERRRRQKLAAREFLERALVIFDAAGAILWAERARGERARGGLRRVAPDHLTENERRVAELAASGLTNREVAAQLFMSPKTVEANLARAYRKLGIRSRAELGVRLTTLEREPAQT